MASLSAGQDTMALVHSRECTLGQKMYAGAMLSVERLGPVKPAAAARWEAHAQKMAAYTKRIHLRECRRTARVST